VSLGNRVAGIGGGAQRCGRAIHFDGDLTHAILSGFDRLSRREQTVVSFMDQRAPRAHTAHAPSAQPDLAETARALALASARAQDLPEQVSDAAVLRSVATILAVPPARRRARPEARSSCVPDVAPSASGIATAGASA
jgi:hypothetical protein